MLAQGRGSIMNIGSLASITALGRGHIAYSMAMGAVVQMTRELSTEWSHRGVRVNAVLPAQVINPSLASRMQARSDARERASSAAFPPGGWAMPRRYQGTGRAAGVRCFDMDHRRAHPDGRRQPGDERRRHAGT